MIQDLVLTFIGAVVLGVPISQHIFHDASPQWLPAFVVWIISFAAVRFFHYLVYGTWGDHTNG